MATKTTKSHNKAELSPFCAFSRFSWLIASSSPLPPAGRPQLGAAGPGVARHLLLAGRHRLARQRFPHLRVAERLLDRPVLQRVEADDDRPPARPQQPRHRLQEAPEGAQLV